MKNVTLIILSAVTMTLSSCRNENVTGEQTGPTVAGFIYTSTNGQSTNQVVRFTRMSDGSISNEKAYSTNSLGGSNPSAGGDAHGDFDFQGSLKIIENYLLVANAGGNTVSVFSLDRKNGDLSLLSNVNSGGKRPVSITKTPVRGSSSEYWVVVANQWDNPNIQKDLPNVQRFPNNAFFLNNLTQADSSDQLRNIELFRFNSSTGSLTLVSQLDTYVRENGGPSDVTFSDDGTKLAVSTWGIAHFGTSSPSLTEQRPSRVYVYNFNNGAISNKRFYEEQGISGTIGISWAKNSTSKIFASNFNTTVAKTNSSVTTLTDNGSTVAKTANFTTGSDTDLDEACWTVLNSSGDRLYVASFTGNVISTYAINAAGDITSKLQVTSRGGKTPEGDSKELYITSDNKYLYNTGALQSYSMNIFDVTNAGVTYRSQTILNTTQGQTGQPGANNFMGLDGFDIKK